ncbi:unnamed protein product [Calicophoron daubneyi]|uniref:RNA polymerase II assembly factor Rtp1 C-terminal domain-containing protein n=1 Tax=Calicophoron daubneyi TaxID=300641 RepID=A0AAV2T8C3_CALDB
MASHVFDSIGVLLPDHQSDPQNVYIELANCVESYLNCIERTDLAAELSGKEVTESFCICCMHCLDMCACVNTKSPNISEPVFSTSNLEKLNKLLQFLVCLGIYPRLDAGVSLPLELRMDSFTNYKCSPKVDKSDRFASLLKIAKCMLRLRNSSLDQLKSLISPKYFLGDLIAALVQVAYGQGIKPEFMKSSNEEIRLAREAQKILWTLLCDLPGYVAMKELLILQGGCKAPVEVKGSVHLPLAPKWLRTTCGRLLSRLLVRPAPISSGVSFGVKNLLLASATLAPGLIGSSRSTTSMDPRMLPALAQGLARILAAPPAFLSKSKSATAEKATLKYYESIAAQVLDVIHLRDSCPSSNKEVMTGDSSDSISRFGHLVGLISVHEVCTRNPDLGKRLFLWPLVGVLQRCVVDDPSAVSLDPVGLIPDTTDAVELASPEQISQLLEYISDLISCPTPSRIVLNELVRHSAPIFQLLVRVTSDERAWQLEADCSEDVTDQQKKKESSVARSQIIAVLCQMLSVAVESRADRLSLLRSWLGLPPSATVPTDHPLVAISCHPRLLFRYRQPVEVLTPCDQRNAESTDVPIPYRCTLSTEPTNLGNTPNEFPSMVDSLVDLLTFMTPCKTPSEDQDMEERPCVQFLLEQESEGKNDAVSSKNSVASMLISDLFLSLVADLNDSISVVLRNQSPDAVFLSFVEGVDDRALTKTAEMGLISSLLASEMIDHFADRIWPQDFKQTVCLFQMTLKRLCAVMQRSDNKELQKFLTETLSQLLGILAFYINQLGPPSGTNSSVRDEFSHLLPTLTELESAATAQPTVVTSSQVELIRCLRVMLATRGAVNTAKVSEHVSVGSEEAHLIPDKSAMGHKLIQELDPVPSDECTDSQPSHSDVPLSPTLQEAFDQLTDPLIPVRGHALIVISRLLESRDQCVFGNEERIYKEVVHQLSDMDSYIYLNAIRALSALGQAFTDRVLAVILRRFHDLGQGAPSRTESGQVADERIEYRLKLCEAIARILRDLGEMAPKYRTVVMNGLMAGTRDPEPLIRAASLSTLSDICCLLRHSIAPVIYEVFALIELNLVHDTSPAVRKAAANLARSLLLSDGDSGLPDWISADVLRDLNRLLSDRAKIERDMEVKEQIEAALGQLDKCARISVFPKPLTPSDLVKEIHVLRPF